MGSAIRLFGSDDADGLGQLFAFPAANGRVRVDLAVQDIAHDVYAGNDMAEDGIALLSPLGSWPASR